MGKAVLFLLVALVALSFAPRVAAFGAGKKPFHHSTLVADDDQAISRLTRTSKIRHIDMEISRISLLHYSKPLVEASSQEAASSLRLM